MRTSLLLFALLAGWILGPSLATPKAAPANSTAVQGLSKTLYKDQINGFKFRPPNDCVVVPARQDLAKLGLRCWMEHEEEEVYTIIYSFDDSSEYGRILKAIADGVDPEDIDWDEAEEDEEGDDKDSEETFVGSSRPAIEDVLAVTFDTFNKSRTYEDKEFKANGNEGRWRVWRAGGVRIEVFSYLGPDSDVHLVYLIGNQLDKSKDGKKWRKMFSKSGKSFDRIATLADVDTSKLSYNELLKFHKDADKQFKDWRVMGTPSEQFIVKTSSKRGAFIKNVISHLEKSRKLFEEDFPPEAFGLEMTAVSVVRICGTEEEFHSYGGTSRGVGGWFNPESEELVLYSGERDKEEDAETKAVMTHEAFHQYCHFLFKRSEAHRWFDEGHGDYYAATGWFEGKAYVKPEAPGGYNRFPHAQKMVGRGDMVPLDQHLNFDHGSWNRNGINSYCQSWSIVYMLRQGALGKVPKQYWKDEYANIIPNYMTTLLKGYAEEYERILKHRKKRAERQGRELTQREKVVSRSLISPSKRKKIWKAAMDASWGKVDLEEFEGRWLDYVEHGIQ